ncbi:MAG TPA: isochorismatase family cysteine hydrolase [Vicinamibacterales bacterium]|nr:isochorismatase family cysteine hydrolase [Vicinamibacterales bacterium]
MGEPNSAGSQRRTALLLVDVINDMEFEGSESLVRCAEPMATRLHELKQRCRDAGIPTVYINDNFGKWRSDFRSLVDHCINDPVPGREVARLLKPDDDDYFVLKPKNSAFFGTTLDTLLTSLNTDTVILTGIAGDNCVLFSANDAYLRDYKLFIPADCIASNSMEENEAALRLMEKVVKADVRPSTELDLTELP